jgi:hypothetical protein
VPSHVHAARDRIERDRDQQALTGGDTNTLFCWRFGEN